MAPRLWARRLCYRGQRLHLLLLRSKLEVPVKPALRYRQQQRLVALQQQVVSTLLRHYRRLQPAGQMVTPAGDDTAELTAMTAKTAKTGAIGRTEIVDATLDTPLRQLTCRPLATASGWRRARLLVLAHMQRQRGQAPARRQRLANRVVKLRQAAGLWHAVTRGCTPDAVTAPIPVATRLIGFAVGVAVEAWPGDVTTRGIEIGIVMATAIETGSRTE